MFMARWRASPRRRAFPRFPRWWTHTGLPVMSGLFPAGEFPPGWLCPSARATVLAGDSGWAYSWGPFMARCSVHLRAGVPSMRSVSLRV